jgi:hypothetical protein
LLVAAVGAVVLARRRRGLEPDAELVRRVEAPRPAYTGTMAEGAGTRVAETVAAAGVEVEAGGERREPAATGYEGGW